MSQLRKKQSLSILSGSLLNQVNGQVPAVVADKPAKDRVFSESTGLIKFSLRQGSEETDVEPKEDEKQGLPIYIPIEENEELLDETEKQTELNEVMFQLAAKQRRSLELKEELLKVDADIRDLESRCRKLTQRQQNRAPKKPAKKQSIMNFAARPDKLAAQEPIAQFSKTINTFTNNLSNNIQTNDLLNRGKAFIENLNKDNEKWLNELQTKASNFKTDQNPMFKKLIGPKDLSSPLIPNFKALNVFNSNHSQSPIRDSRTDHMDPEFEYSECQYYDQTLVSDDEHYGGHTVPYLAPST
ncbi:hypothetical protein OGAPHI_005277 [Ogataea philodendri]|uniref:Uncharacterized protein n=1 Tax=Ogataea philodendri TaxID=1378263 RepID=A0A9P8T367_9ASCO|nr:uncharacterized protein OGAPHI_005277 [Ogataea philodendri]KAH3663874.1 hypothetical protein OGAPHI_005277 [Ogataea philodendri]